jgi:hypothetical protein
MPMFCAVGAGGVTNAEIFVGAAAKLRLKTRTRRRYIAARANLHCTDKAGFIYSAPLFICRVALLLLRQRRGAVGLGELQRTRGQNKDFATAPAHTQRALHGANSPRGWSAKTTSFSSS